MIDIGAYSRNYIDMRTPQWEKAILILIEACKLKKSNLASPQVRSSWETLEIPGDSGGS